MDDLRALNDQLKLWTLFPEYCKQMPFWLPAGGFVRSALEEFWRQEHFRQGYELVYTPHIASEKLWRVTGHIGRFQDRMFPPLEDEQKDPYWLRPMNCPFHMLVFSSTRRTYSELPLRLAELGTVYRLIPSGSFKEIFEVRGFTQDDAHIFLPRDRDKVKEEVAAVVRLILFFLRDIFNLTDYRVVRRLRPADALGTDEEWQWSQAILQDVLEELEVKYADEPGEGVFYGPKIDFELRDEHYRKAWICSTVQLDSALPLNFGLKFYDRGGRQATPVMIHRTILGSLERFIALLVSRTAGHLPVWLCPYQVTLIPVRGSERELNVEYANRIRAIVENALPNLHPRIRVLPGLESVSDEKVRAIREKVPFVVVVGGSERLAQNVSVVRWTGQKYSDPESLSLETLIQSVEQRIRART